MQAGLGIWRIILEKIINNIDRQFHMIIDLNIHSMFFLSAYINI